MEEEIAHLSYDYRRVLDRAGLADALPDFGLFNSSISAAQTTSKVVLTVPSSSSHLKELIPDATANTLDMQAVLARLVPRLATFFVGPDPDAATALPQFVASNSYAASLGQLFPEAERAFHLPAEADAPYGQILVYVFDHVLEAVVAHFRRKGFLVHVATGQRVALHDAPLPSRPAIVLTN